MRTRFGVVLFAVMVLAACGPDDGGDASSGKSTPTATVSSQPTSVTSDPAPSEPASTPTSEEPEASEPAGVPTTKEGAIGRYETFLHALGSEDIDTMCEIAGPAAKKAEQEGVGPCEQSFGMMLQLISPEQKTALKTATIDQAQSVVQSPKRVDVPVSAVRADVTFTESDLGDATLEYIDGNWFITD